MDTSDSEITFDKNGVCSHCEEFKIRFEPKWYPNREGKKKLDQIIDQIKEDGKGKDYDCIIGLSGGVDSSYLAYVLRTQYPTLRILAIHIDGGWNSELAVHNIENIVKIIDIDLYTSVINWEEMKDLQLAYFKSQLANQDVPQDHAFFATLYDVADKQGIKYFLSGSNIATESILPSSWGYSAGDGTQLRAVHKKFGRIKLKEYKTFSFFKSFIYYPYIKKFKVIAPLDLLPYNKEQAKRVIKDNTNWRDYGGKHHESRFTKFFQAYWLPEKFGYDKRRAHLSSLIVSGQMSREEALKEIEKPLYDPKELEEDIDFLSKKMGLSVGDFKDIMSMPNKTFRDYPSDYFLVKSIAKLLNVVKKIK